MHDFETINLTFVERSKLTLMRFKRKVKERYFGKSLRYLIRNDLISPNHKKEQDPFGSFIPDGTYSLTEKYRRYKIYVRKKKLEALPNWVAITISLISLIISAITLLWQLGYV